jgi:hypothetical protein
MSNYSSGPRIDFAMFKNKYAKTDKHPKETGKIEMTREFLKAMVEVAKTGVMPELKTGVMPELKLASWDNVSKKGLAYRSIRMEIVDPNSQNTESREEETAASNDGDDMPW